MDVEAASSWKDNLLQMTSDRDAKYIFNLDKTGLFIKCMPDKTLAFNGQNCSGGKHSNGRLTLLAEATMDGLEKLPSLIIRKSANPHCLKM